MIPGQLLVACCQIWGGHYQVLLAPPHPLFHGLCFFLLLLQMEGEVHSPKTRNGGLVQMSVVQPLQPLFP